MVERRKTAQGSVNSTRGAVTARGADTSNVRGAMELFSGESGDAVPRKSTPCYAAPAGEGAQAPVFDFDVLSPVRPSRTVLRHVVNRWTPLVVMVLADRPSRFGKLRARIGGMAPRVLTRTLRSMERGDLVTHTQLLGMPPRVDYELTDLDHSLRAPIDALHTWTYAYSAQILARRESYDATES